MSVLAVISKIYQYRGTNDSYPGPVSTLNNGIRIKWISGDGFEQEVYAGIVFDPRRPSPSPGSWMKNRSATRNVKMRNRDIGDLLRSKSAIVDPQVMRVREITLAVQSISRVSLQEIPG
jgi:UDP-N-acetylglucosamine pyrophosphorylase